MNTDAIKLTIKDIELCKDTVLTRHQQEPTLCLRLGSIFTQMVNTLSATAGISLDPKQIKFQPTPLRTTKETHKKLEIPKIDIDEATAFKETVQAVHENFLNRTNTEIMDGLTHLEIRGVAKLAGMPDFDKHEIDGGYITLIKRKMQADNEITNQRKDTLKKINWAKTTKK